MITIKKGDHILQVSKSTYEAMFKIMGYNIVDGEETRNKKVSSANDNISKSDIKENIIVNDDEKKKIENDSKKNEQKEDNNLENILGILSKNNDEKLNNRQSKNKEEK